MRIFNPFRRLRPEPVHLHRWHPIAVNQGVINHKIGEQVEPYNSTEILQVCECGEFKRDIIFGHWALEQVQAGELSRDVQELRRMVSL
jgi:hypothetical protein